MFELLTASVHPLQPKQKEAMRKKKKGFEDQLVRLQEIVTALEKGNLSLEEGVAMFQEGSELAKSCRDQLTKAKHTVQLYADGILQDLDPPDPEKDSSDHETETE